MNNDELQFHLVARADEIAPGSGQTIEVNGKQLALFNVAGQFYAIGNMCPHRGAALSDGFLSGNKVFCPWHCFDFDLQTGASDQVPSLSVQTYETKREGDDIFVRC